MGIQKVTENILVVTLPEKNKIDKTLEDVNNLLFSGCETDVIIDFSRIEIITSTAISNLHILQNIIKKCGRKLFLCHLSLPAKCEFRVMGVDGIFTFTDDKYSAINLLQAQNSSSD